jgi:hypothetical protein
MMQDPAMAGSNIVFIGGDFNAAPIPRRNRAGTQMTPYSQATVAAGGGTNTLTAAQLAAGAVAGGTTWWGSLYDYWFSTIPPPPPPPVATVDVRTMDWGLAGLMSDHVASLLQV